MKKVYAIMQFKYEYTNDDANYVYIERDCKNTKEEAEEYIKDWYEWADDCQVCYVLEKYIKE